MQEACWPRWKQCNKEGDEGHRRWWSTPISNTNKPLPPSSAAPPRSWDCTAAWVSPAAGGHKGGETEVVLPENEIMTGRVTTEVPPLRDKIMSSVSHINQRLQFTTFSVNLFTLTFPELCSKKVSRWPLLWWPENLYFRITEKRVSCVIPLSYVTGGLPASWSPMHEIYMVPERFTVPE